MSSPASYADHTSDLYCTIYGNEPERQSDVYAQNNMELFEKVWFPGGATTTTTTPTDKEQDGDKHTTTKTAAAGGARGPHEDDDGEDQEEEGEQTVDEQAHVAKDGSAACIPLDWPEIPDQGPSSMQWTCDICDTQMSIFFRTEHLASEHPPKQKRPRGPRRKAESDSNTPMWHCELCDEQVNIFYTAEHTTGKKHVLKLKQSGEYQYTPASEQFIEHRAVYTPQDGEQVLAADDWEPGEYPPGGAYEEDESAVYKPEKGEQGHDDWDPDGNAGGGEQPEGSAAYGEGGEEEEEEEEEEYWEAEDMIIHRPLANEAGPSGFSGLESLTAPPPPTLPYPTQTSAAMGYPGQLSAGAKYMHSGQAAAEPPKPQPQLQPPQPPSQPRYQAFLSRLAGDKTQEPLSPHIAIHIQVPTFYCELCDTEYPISEQDKHPEDTKECTICDDEYHVNQYPAHLASRDHRENAKAQGYAPPVPKVALPAPPPAPPPPPPAVVKVSRFHCELCNKTMGADSRASHLAGMKHKAKQQEFAAAHAARKSNAPPRPTNPLVVVQARTESPKGFMGAFGVAKSFSCGLCKISMTVDVRDAHLASATHREREAAKAMEWSDSPESAGAPAARGASGSGWVRDAETVRCEPCQRTISVNSWPSHTAGRKHKENVEASKAAPTPLNVSNLARAMSSQASSPITRRWDPTPGAGRPNGAASFPQTEYQADMFHCKPCGISMHINNRETHIGGIRHGEAVASTSQGAPASQYSGASSNGALPAPPPAQIPNYRCELCNMNMPLPEYQNHKYGKKHRTNELANAQKQNDNAAPAVPTSPKVKVPLPKPGVSGKLSPRNIATEMVVTKVDGDLVVEVLKMEPDMRTGWCGICQEEVLRTTESHRSEAWKCDLCGITTHAAWKDLHMNTHDQRKSVSMFHRLGAYKML